MRRDRRYKRNRRKFRLQLFIIIFSLVILAGLSWFFYQEIRPMVVKVVIQEAGSAIPEVEQFLIEKDQNGSFITEINKLDLSTPGSYEVQIKVGNRSYTSELEIVDTTPPKAAAVNREIWVGEEADAASFVTDISDASEVKSSFQNIPDFTKEGEIPVTVIMEDSYGNSSAVSAMATVKADKEPPVFSGISDQTVLIGETVSYKKKVTVSDNRDKEVTFKVDSSRVHMQKEGTYEVIYRAVDASGNEAKESAFITVKEFIVTEEEFNRTVDGVLDKIIEEGMTKKEKAWEIYQWVRNHIAYTGSSDKSDWREEAYRGITNAAGDCFTYYAVSEAMLTRAGIDNMRVTRVGGRTKHFWNLIDCGEGWYHFDACPNKDKMQSFMLTDTEVEEYTKKRGNNYYTFDKSLYPRTPEK